MLGLVIDYLEPFILAAVNLPAMTLLQGTTLKPRAVVVFDTRAGAGDQEVSSIPYVKIYPATESARWEAVGFGQGGSNQVEKRILIFECVCQGDTREQADARSDALQLAVEGQIQFRKQRPEIRLNDIGGTTAYNKIANWMFVPAADPVVRGPGGNNTWTASKFTRLEVWIEKVR